MSDSSREPRRRLLLRFWLLTAAVVLAICGVGLILSPSLSTPTVVVTTAPPTASQETRVEGMPSQWSVSPSESAPSPEGVEVPNETPPVAAPTEKTPPKEANEATLLIAGEPVNLHIPAVGLNIPILPLPKETIENCEITPPYEQGVIYWLPSDTESSCGEIAKQSTYLVGHSDTASYWPLNVLSGQGGVEIDDSIQMTMKSGEVRSYTIDKLESMPKGALATSPYWDTDRKDQIILISCSIPALYAENVVVTASLDT